MMLELQPRTDFAIELPTSMLNGKLMTPKLQSVKREGTVKVVTLFFLSLLLLLIAFGTCLGGLSSLQLARTSFPPPEVNSFVPVSHTHEDTEEEKKSISNEEILRDYIIQLKSEEWYWGGTSLHHNMSDEELFWKASSVAGEPLNCVSKVAFMFLTKGPLPLAPLWEAYFKGNEDYYSIYVHTVPGYTLDVPSWSVFHGRQIPSQAVQWGDISMVDAERRLLGNAILDSSNERFILLSETCIPLHSFSTFYDYVIQSQHSFVGVMDELGPYGRGRYTIKMKPEISLDQWRKAPQWFEVTRYLALYIVTDETYYPKFRNFCKPPCYSDEHYIPTFLSIYFGSQLANRSLTATDWSRGGPHPTMYRNNDITTNLLNRLRNNSNCFYNGNPGHTCYFFARKFSRDTLEPLQQLHHQALN
ncbi:hypothetical protein O6H91_01G096000 [Diphasiastrum complanatum]|uniref:Uncharacterized protein n=2 Tax=Diphasiastrum complanatum TaxID=34168 RepID=A0ACC2ETC8_DIPCM|nr:hypothetical protein O6H91_01G095100 [Diphasiastrum complanatum]KAJ7569819.1 hypothetical protein O6H91_01G096000 [Diphasiastrum complanatum]